MRALPVLFGLMAVAATPAVAQTQPVQDETTVEDIVVNGGTLEQQARRFVDEVSRPTPHRGLARWLRPVCVGVVNFRPTTARLIADTIATTAGDLGVDIIDGQCRPNLFIVGAADGQEMANEWVRRRPNDFDLNVSGSHDRASALEAFRTGDDPVRWWHLSLPMYYDVFTGQVSRAVRLPGEEQAPQIRVYARSQLRGRTRDDLFRTVVIVDVGMAERLTVQQLCDYLTMVAFAQVDPDADMTAYPTILNVFEHPTGVAGLTDWDRAYLSALYDSDETHRLNPDQQASGVADNLRTDLPAEAADQQP